MLSGGQEFQHECGAVHRLAPAVLVGAAANPRAPKVHRLLERVWHVIGPSADRRLIRRHHFEHEPRRFVGAQREPSLGRSLRQLHWDRGAQPKGELTRTRAADEQDFGVAAPLHSVRPTPIVEARIAAHDETHFTTDRLRATHEVVRDAGILDRHEIGDFGDAAVGQESRQQHVGVGKVQLPVYRIIELRRDLEAAPAIGVQESGKHGG